MMLVCGLSESTSAWIRECVCVCVWGGVCVGGGGVWRVVKFSSSKQGEGRDLFIFETGSPQFFRLSRCGSLGPPSEENDHTPMCSFLPAMC